MNHFRRLFSKRSKEALVEASSSLTRVYLNSPCPNCGKKEVHLEKNGRPWCSFCGAWAEKANYASTVALPDTSRTPITSKESKTANPQSGQTSSPKVPTTTEALNSASESQQPGHYQTLCLNCEAKMQPIEDLGLAMQGGSITCSSCGEAYSYSITGNSVTIHRVTVPRGWTGPVKQSWVRVSFPTKPSGSEPPVQKSAVLQTPIDSMSEDLARAEALFNDYKRSEAIKFYDKVIAVDRKNVSALFGRARCYGWNNDYVNALKDIDAALLIDPLNADYWHYRGFIHADMKQYEQAIADAQKALEVRPYHYDAYYLRGRSYFELKRYDESESDFKQCKQIKPHILNPDDFLKKIKVMRAPHFETIYTAVPNEAVEILVKKALVLIPIVPMETVKENYAQLQDSWSSKVLAIGTIEHIQSIVLKNLKVYASRADFEKFRVDVHFEDDFAQVNAFFHHSFIGIRVWRCQDCFCACGNANFIT